ncbi:SGNH/GDSL hydrolase family protein [Peribacillus loiseleuriae]|uniref:SGNH/GDSL hydrolase family protein n=1 Tax=Peribacillus loiseleuriae TaxID=1679170 RepID=UPI003D0045F9
MQQLPLSAKMFHGAVSIEKTETYMKPWRIPFDQAEIFLPNGIGGQAEIPAGVRITIRSNTKIIKIGILDATELMQMDCLINGSLYKTAHISKGDTSVHFDGFSDETKLIEIYLSQKVAVPITGIWIDEHAKWELVEDSRLHWVTYGSSITHCYYSESPSQTWPALASNEMDFNLTCLGYSGNCFLEPTVARMIRDMPADFISMCVGINIVRGNALSDRTFAPALMGFIQITRDKQKDVPIAIISPIFNREYEKTENKVGLSLEKTRKEIVQVIETLKKYGDQNLYYLDGLEMFGEEYEKYMPDGLHPNAEGDKILAVRFQQMAEANVPMRVKNK